ncbi:MAG: hypothetical protein AAFO79_09340 [Pseudomonadota bacterium]
MSEQILTATLNARLQPMHRFESFEEPLNTAMQAEKVGEVTGGGTMMASHGEVSWCDLELAVGAVSQASIERVVAELEQLGAPKGSYLSFPDGDVRLDFGAQEGLAIYLNGTDLPASVYETSDINDVIEDLETALGDRGALKSWWEGPEETALYLYGPSYANMRELIAPILAATPLCQQCRCVQIA